jgi:DNA-directed RNA polymerase subunit H (RpoH/RPB5)|tara:strand:- start:11501 stop:12115 length:615 start_codon:yes stop_codon:yes gene_type:complete
MEIDTIISNIKEMLVERGDNIDEFEEHERDIEREDFYNDSRILEFHTSNTTIIFCMTKKLRKNILDELKSYSDNITKFITKYNNKKNIVLIFNNDVISAPILQQLNKYDKMLQKNEGMLQYFYAKQLLFNPTKHEYVPKHMKLTDQEEINKLLETYMIKSKLHLPLINHNDIIAKWLGLKQGDIVKIIRNNKNSGIYYYYRCCI